MTTRSLRSAIVLVVGSIAVAACSFSPRLDPRLPDPAASSHILAADGTVLATLDRGIHRTPISLRSMGHVVPDAVVAVEDHRYFEHSGVDVRAIARALRDDLRAGRVVEGGSTITQQYVRNVLLSGERTAHRKLREAILAIEVERHYTKAQILERYLNAVYFGDGAYGVETAAERYFGTSAARLTLGQGALLAGLLQAPEHDNPRRFPAAALARRNVVLDAMVRYHRTTPTAAAAAAAEPLRLAPPADDHGHAAYFVDAVRTWFLAQPRFGATEADRAHALYQGGLHIATTLDPTAQRAAETAIAGILTDRHHDPAAALVSIEPTTGRVVAYVGGRGTDGPEPWAQFDLAGRARRPAGSTFKPFVLSAALERHIPLTRSYDAPAALTLHPPGAPAWVVHNHDGRSYGRLDLVEATVQSVNTVYAQLMLDVGPTYAVGVARRLGIGTPLAPIAGAVLGFDDVSPVDLAQAYATIAADGVLTPATFVTSVTAPDGTVLYRAEPQHHRVLDAGVARTVNHTLEAVVQRGTGVAARIGRPVAGKTGTTDDYDDAWFAGSTPQLTTVVWVGGPQRYAMVPPRTRIRVTGATWPAQIWARYSSTVLGSRPVVDFPEPTADQAAGLLDVEVPNVVGMPEHAAQDILHSAALLNSVTLVPDDQYPPGTVLSEDPPASTTVPTNTTVHLTVVASADDPVVPDLLGLAPAAAQAEAVAARLVLHITTAPESTPVPDARRGVVWKQTPASATVLAPGASISVWVNPR